MVDYGIEKQETHEDEEHRKPPYAIITSSQNGGQRERTNKQTKNDAVFRNQLNAYCSKDAEQMRNK